MRLVVVADVIVSVEPAVTIVSAVMKAVVNLQEGTVIIVVVNLREWTSGKQNI